MEFPICVGNMCDQDCTKPAVSCHHMLKIHTKGTVTPEGTLWSLKVCAINSKEAQKHRRITVDVLPPDIQSTHSGEKRERKTYYWHSPGPAQACAHTLTLLHISVRDVNSFIRKARITVSMSITVPFTHLVQWAITLSAWIRLKIKRCKGHCRRREGDCTLFI